ncbi:hypothetical protein KC957_04235 [Candidatus Saccharibacteria bacterium]|nr:hypothetical protein [Candidatus Saccharibacteria bacterium]
MKSLKARLPKRPIRIRHSRFVASWQELQGYCKNKATWPQAVMSADKLLDAALKKRHFKGKTMGERLVAAQNSLSDNDMVWTAHNMAKKIMDAPDISLREKDVKLALIGFRQALKDLGAFSADYMYSRDMSATEESTSGK